MGKIIDGVYYGTDGNPAHRGVVKIGDKFYYAGKDGVLVRDKIKTIHHGMANGLVRHGDYYFDEDGVMDLSSFTKNESHHESDSKEERKHNKKKYKKRHKKKNKKETLVVIILTILILIASIFVTISMGTDAPEGEIIIEKNGEPIHVVIERPGE